MAVACPSGHDASGRTSYAHLTYGQLDTRSTDIARGLKLYGIGRGVRTVLMVRPGLDLFSLVFGMFKVGAVPVLIDPGIGRRNIKQCIANSQPEALIGVPEAQIAGLAFGWGRGTVCRRITVGRKLPGCGATLREIEQQGAESAPFQMAETEADETAAVVFTSGSTGPPKGVVYRHRNFMAQVEALREMFGLNPGEIDLPTFPLFALFDPALGMTTVIPHMDPTCPAKVDPRRIIEPIEDFGVTMMFGSPALLDTVGRYGEQHGVKLPSLKRVLSAGAPVPPRVIERFAGMLPEDARILTPYGASEALPVAVISSDEIMGETGSGTDRGAGVCVGHPVPSIELELMRVTDEATERWDPNLVVPAGEIGEIVVKGEQVTTAYYNAPRHDHLSKMHDADGGIRHRMGDLGYWDDQGRLWFVGRKSQRVVTADGTLYTDQCEGVFNTHPAVYRSALVGVGDEGALVPVICVELEKSATAVDKIRLFQELQEIGGRFEHTRSIRAFLCHPGFPVDIRHNAKIGRGQLAKWAARKLKR